MLDLLIADLLDRCLDQDDDPSHTIESQLKIHVGILAESQLDLSA